MGINHVMCDVQLTMVNSELVRRRERDRRRERIATAKESHDKKENPVIKSKRGYFVGEVNELHMLDEFRIEKRETHELRLVQVHHKQFIGGREVGLFAGELLVEIAHILTVFL